MDNGTNVKSYRDQQQEPIDRKASMATTITIVSRPTMVTKKSTTSTVVSDSRRPSAPLSIAERFMSSNYRLQDNTIITKADGFSFDTSTSLTTATASIDSPINQTDRLSVSVSSPSLSSPPPPPPPLFSSCFDPKSQDVNSPYEYSAPHPLDKTHSNARRKAKCNSGCSKMHNCKRKSKASLYRKQHHSHNHKHGRNNKIDIIKAIAADDDTVPEKPKNSEVGMWVGSCCFIQCGGGLGKQDPILPTKHRHHRDGRCCCWGRRAWVIITFLMVLMIAVLVFFFWPRIPLIRIEGAINTIPTKVTQTQQGGRTSNVAFESTWLLNITMDNRRNFFTTRFNRIQIIAKDAMTGLLIGKGLNNNVEAGIVVYLPGKEISTIQLPISVNYQARDTTDTTFSNLMKACHVNSTTESSHHSLSIHFWFTLYIFGLDWLGYKPTLIATPATGGFFCPSLLY
ncbi:hypothetical protein HMPREF1544_04519 [Mucor circinelloides 1006PhL]|uniref:Uncharacterized protein n=1 Tax=Mucor circinelloides f. circinelloides (strain 1006PhL) TaxID=1220926 RepID=S2JJG3_MUCC1|nr:hypothetical protein HMPREF1544_04519 [Mucor circinelloides 1006PhL]KAG1121159.1 hypothetical protein G6F42_012607 [Rhizopus arrhizus]